LQAADKKQTAGQEHLTGGLRVIDAAY